MIVTKNHLSVVAASFIRLRTRSLPTSTAVVKPNVGTPGGSGRSLSIVFGTWATASLPPSTRATAAAPDAVSSPPIVRRYEAPGRPRRGSRAPRRSPDAPLELRGVGPGARRAVAARPVAERALPVVDPRRVAGPGRQGCGLQRPRKGKAERPGRLLWQTIHRVEVGGRELVRLPTR